MIRLALLCALCSAGAVNADPVALPSNAMLTAEKKSPVDSYALPIGPWEDGILPTRVFEGPVLRQAWRIGQTGLTTLQLLRPLRDQLEPQGYEVVFDCASAACGGFDFRFETPVIAEPDMHVDLGDFRFMSLIKDDTAISLLVSRSTAAGYLQITTVGLDTETQGVAPNVTSLRPERTADETDLAATLLAEGRVVLDDLLFETGSTELGGDDFGSLQVLADLLADQPDLSIALVGHTDSTGGLDVNIKISRQRAVSVLERLATRYGAPRDRMEAEGMGYLSPVASNLSAEGREANRRVEAIVTTTR